MRAAQGDGNCALGESVDELALAFVPPLSAENDRDHHIEAKEFYLGNLSKGRARGNCRGPCGFGAAS